MSVEEARDKYNDVVANEERCWATKEQEDAAFRILILEVQAELLGRLFPGGPPEYDVIGPMLAEIRAELARREVAV